MENLLYEEGTLTATIGQIVTDLKKAIEISPNAIPTYGCYRQYFCGFTIIRLLNNTDEFDLEFGLLMGTEDEEKALTATALLNELQNEPFSIEVAIEYNGWQLRNILPHNGTLFDCKAGDKYINLLCSDCDIRLYSWDALCEDMKRFADEYSDAMVACLCPEDNNICYLNNYIYYDEDEEGIVLWNTKTKGGGITVSEFLNSFETTVDGGVWFLYRHRSLYSLEKDSEGHFFYVLESKDGPVIVCSCYEQICDHRYDGVMIEGGLLEEYQPQDYYPEDEEYNPEDEEYYSEDEDYDSEDEDYDSEDEEYNPEDEEYYSEDEDYDSEDEDYDSEDEDYDFEDEDYDSEELSANCAESENFDQENLLESGDLTDVDDMITFTANGVSFNMIKVEGGTFTMGATSEMEEPWAFENETPTHKVTLSSYYMGQTEVTQELWKAVMGKNPSELKREKLPVESVSWNDCQKFIEKLNNLTGKNFRLPTEAEWEFAARGGNKSNHTTYSGSDFVDDVAWCEWHRTPHPVAKKQANELGIYDMSGNVEEWCNDWYGDYNSSSQKNPTGPTSGTYRVVRGGSCGRLALCCGSSKRFYYRPGQRDNLLGLRLCLSE